MVSRSVVGLAAPVVDQRVLSGCMGKRRFRGLGEALAHLKRRKRRRRVQTKNGCGLHPYRCRACGHWHIGSDSW